MHSRLEISISRQHRRGDEVVFVDRLFNFRMQRSGISDAGRAAVTDQIEPELVEIFLQTGLVEIIGDNAGAGRE